MDILREKNVFVNIEEKKYLFKLKKKSVCPNCKKYLFKLKKKVFFQIEMVSRLVVHDWEREYYRTGIKELGFKVEKEVNCLALSQLNVHPQH